MRINEIWTNFVPSVTGNYKNRQAIYKWCEVYHVPRPVVNPDMTVTVLGDVRIQDASSIPFQFRVVQGTFDISDCPGMKSFKGCPFIIEGNFLAMGCEKITTLEHAPTYVEGTFNANRTGIRDIHNVHKVIKHAQHAAFGNALQNALGLMLIEGIQAVTVGHLEASKIFNDALTRGEDIHTVQEKLIDAGYARYARL